jgi:hypothetical protein
MLIDRRPVDETTHKKWIIDHKIYVQRMGDDQFNPRKLNVLSHALADGLPSGSSVEIVKFDVVFLESALAKENIQKVRAASAAAVSPALGAAIASSSTTIDTELGDGVQCTLRINVSGKSAYGTSFVPAADEIRVLEGLTPQTTQLGTPVVAAIKACALDAAKKITNNQ